MPRRKEDPVGRALANALYGGTAGYAMDFAENAGVPRESGGVVHDLPWVKDSNGEYMAGPGWKDTGRNNFFYDLEGVVRPLPGRNRRQPPQVPGTFLEHLKSVLMGDR